jgi:hypothetical protein
VPLVVDATRALMIGDGSALGPALGTTYCDPATPTYRQASSTPGP